MIRLNPTYIFLAILAGIALFVVYDAKYNYVDWRTANRSSAGIAPNPRVENRRWFRYIRPALITGGVILRCIPWIAVKRERSEFLYGLSGNGMEFAQRTRCGFGRKDLPDRYWYGNRPQLLQSLIGEAAEKAIPAIEKAAAAYPYADRYKLWPGPNSNSFVAYVLRRVPQLTVELPPTAIGKRFPRLYRLFMPRLRAEPAIRFRSSAPFR